MIAISEETEGDMKQISLRTYFYLFDINSMLLVWQKGKSDVGIKSNDLNENKAGFFKRLFKTKKVRQTLIIYPTELRN